MPTRTNNKCITVCPFYISNGGAKKPEPIVYLKGEFRDQPKHPFRMDLGDNRTAQEAIPPLMRRYGANKIEIHETNHPNVFAVHVLEGEMQNEAKQIHTTNFFSAIAKMSRDEVVEEGIAGVSALAEFIRDFMQGYKSPAPVGT